jgi:hypothetical protein
MTMLSHPWPVNLDSGPSRAASAQPHQAVLSNYPSYLSAPRPRPVKTYSPIVSSVGAYAAAFVAQMVAAFPLGIWVVGYGMSTIAEGGEIRQAAARAALVVIVTTSLVGTLAAWIVLRFRKVPAALLVAFLGQVAEQVGAGLGTRLADGVGWVAGALAAMCTTYWLITWRRMRDSNPRGR